ncbi:MAG: hypothetical protein R2873_10295 [Caldilineaceae bacterium]
MSYGGVAIGTINATSNGVDGVDLLINLNANSNAAAVEILIENLTYANTSDAPNSSRQLRIVVDDGDGGTSPVAAATITVTAQNDVPVISNLAGDTLSYTEGDSDTVIEQGADVSVTDPDSANFDTGTLTISFVGVIPAPTSGSTSSRLGRSS